jgi:hypothetical protein
VASSRVSVTGSAPSIAAITDCLVAAQGQQHKGIAGAGHDRGARFR